MSKTIAYEYSLSSKEKASDILESIYDIAHQKGYILENDVLDLLGFEKKETTCGWNYKDVRVGWLTWEKNPGNWVLILPKYSFETPPETIDEMREAYYGKE